VLSEPYLFIAIFFIVVGVFSVAPLVLAWLLSPKRSSRWKRETYESGMRTFGATWIEFKPQYYLFALAFVIFDVEAALLLPFAVAYDALPLYAIAEVSLFLLLLAFALLYVWLKGWLRWM
jgi:NADH-quinone oxidoreductase subunit A